MTTPHLTARDAYFRSRAASAKEHTNILDEVRRRATEGYYDLGRAYKYSPPFKAHLESLGYKFKIIYDKGSGKETGMHLLHWSDEIDGALQENTASNSIQSVPSVVVTTTSPSSNEKADPVVVPPLAAAVVSLYKPVEEAEKQLKQYEAQLTEFKATLEFFQREKESLSKEDPSLLTAERRDVLEKMGPKIAELRQRLVKIEAAVASARLDIEKWKEPFQANNIPAAIAAIKTSSPDEKGSEPADPPTAPKKRARAGEGENEQEDEDENETSVPVPRKKVNRTLHFREARKD